MTTHDYAGCQLEACALCDAYGDGYTHGKDNARFEVYTIIDAPHAPDCGCEPCRVIRRVRHGFLGAD